MSRTDQLAGTHLAPDPADLERLVAGAHHNPHGILGAHEYGDHTVVRAFRPHAVEVVAIVGDRPVPDAAHRSRLVRRGAAVHQPHRLPAAGEL